MKMTQQILIEEINKLIIDLGKAKELLLEYDGGYSGDFHSAEEFRNALSEKTEMLENGNFDALKDLWVWFAPTSAWDDFVGTAGLQLGNEIFERTNSMKNQQLRLDNLNI